MVQTIVLALIIFGLLIFVHEFGHFIIAKLVGIRVEEFSIGMGPKAFSTQKGDTLYSVRLLPIGGYVKMEGEDEASNDSRSFNKKSPLQRISVIAAGPIMNIVLAIILFMIIALNIGTPITKIQDVTDNSPAQSAGILPGDKIISIDNKKIDTWEDIVKVVGESKKETLQIELSRNNEKLNLEVKPIVDKNTNKRLIGITPVFTKSVGASFKFSIERVSLIVKGIGDFLSKLIKGQASSEEVVGPIGMVHFVGEAARIGILSLLSLAAVISINLAILNILPFPALDGGRLLFIFAELITGKPIDPEKEGFIHFVGFVVLISLMIFVLYKDISKFNIF